MNREGESQLEVAHTVQGKVYQEPPQKKDEREKILSREVMSCGSGLNWNL